MLAKPKGKKSSTSNRAKTIRVSIILIALSVVLLYSISVALKYFSGEGQEEEEEEELKQGAYTENENSSKPPANSAFSKKKQSDKAEFFVENPLFKSRAKPNVTNQNAVVPKPKQLVKNVDADEVEFDNFINVGSDLEQSDSEHEPLQVEKVDLAEKFCLEKNPTAASFLERLRTMLLWDVEDEKDERLGLIDAYLEAGVDIYEVVKDISPIMFCIQHWMLPALKRMKNIDVSTKVAGSGVMFICARAPVKTEKDLQRSLATLKYLLSLGANINGLPDETCGTPLSASIYNGNTEIVTFLLVNGADPSLTCYKRDTLTPLMLATQLEKFEIIPVLLEYGANILAKTTLHMNALEFALISAKREALSIFIERDPKEAQILADKFVLGAYLNMTVAKSKKFDATELLMYLCEKYKDLPYSHNIIDYGCTQTEIYFKK